MNRLCLYFLLSLSVLYVHDNIYASSEAVGYCQNQQEERSYKEIRRQAIRSVIARIDQASTCEEQPGNDDVENFKHYCNTCLPDVEKVASEFGYRPMYNRLNQRWCLDIIN